MATEHVDEAKAEDFTNRVVDILNGGMLSLMISIGHRTGLFDVMAGLPPSTSGEVAAAAGLNERYVIEWLGAMTTGRIVRHDAAAKRFWFPPKHAACLTRAAGPDNLASQAQYVAMLGDVETQIVDCFKNGGGVPYSSYPAFQKLMAEESSQVFDATLLDVTLPLVPGLVDRLTAGIDVADVGCGSGHAINLMARAFPKSRFVGYDFSQEGIAVGREEEHALGLTNADFEQKDVASLAGHGRFDFITTFDAVHDQAHPDRVLKGIAGLLRPGGDYLCVDIGASSNVAENVDHPLGPLLYTISCMHCMTVSLALGGAGLGAVWGRQKALAMLADAGFKDVVVKNVEGDIFNNYYIAHKN
jgi:2-polyprenyl-3-methyl-5-hydroxy-6-metoxy-1,4-benzoquinol methylase